MAKINIKTGPIIQFKRSETERILVSLKTFGKSEKLTLAKGGYIITIKPIAMGIFVVPLLNELMTFGNFGKKYPTPTPIAIAINIHRVKFYVRENVK